MEVRRRKEIQSQRSKVRKSVSARSGYESNLREWTQNMKQLQTSVSDIL